MPDVSRGLEHCLGSVPARARALQGRLAEQVVRQDQFGT